MATLIDSSVLIAAERGDLALDAFAARYAQEDVAISAVSASDLCYNLPQALEGVKKSTLPTLPL